MAFTRLSDAELAVELTNAFEEAGKASEEEIFAAGTDFNQLAIAVDKMSDHLGKIILMNTNIVGEMSLRRAAKSGADVELIETLLEASALVDKALSENNTSEVSLFEAQSKMQAEVDRLNKEREQWLK